MGRLRGEIILLNCCKSLQINRTFFQAATVLSEDKRRYRSSQDQSGTKSQTAALPISASRDGPPASNRSALPAALCRRVSAVRTDTGTTALVRPGRCAFGSLPAPWVDAFFVSLPVGTGVGSSTGRVGQLTPGCWSRRSPLLRRLLPRRREALPSSRITLLPTCPALRSRWGPARLPWREQYGQRSLAPVPFGYPHPPRRLRSVFPSHHPPVQVGYSFPKVDGVFGGGHLVDARCRVLA